MVELEAMGEESEALIPLVIGEFSITKFRLRKKKEIELNEEQFTGKLRKHKN
jgi:hypothetical protein